MYTRYFAKENVLVQVLKQGTADERGLGVMQMRVCAGGRKGWVECSV